MLDLSDDIVEQMVMWL